MRVKRWLWIVALIGAVATLAVGSGYWVKAQRAHDSGEGHMMQKGHHGGKTMKDGQHGSMMPMMHGNMSEEEMENLCDRMRSHHEAMREKRRKQKEKLNDLVASMKEASGEEKIEAMQETLIELVNQHQHQRKAMKRSMHSMMGSMMGMHRMGDQQRQQMMQRMQDCPMMQGMKGSGEMKGTPMSSPDERHHE